MESVFFSFKYAEKEMKHFYNVKVVFVSCQILVDLRQNDLCKNFLIGVGMAMRENSLSENIAGCFYLIAKRKQLLSWEVFIIELGLSAYHTIFNRLHILIYQGEKFLKRTRTLMDRTLIIIMPLTKVKKKKYLFICSVFDF